jgi:yecA family protein
MSHLDAIQDVGKILTKSRRKHLSEREVHGLLTGILCGPKVVPPIQWLASIFSGTRDLKPLTAKPWFGSLVEDLVTAYEDLLFSLRAGTFVPYLTENESDKDKLEAAREWCTGYLYGMHLHGEQWSSSTDEHLASLTAPLFYLADPEQLASELEPSERDKLAEKAVDMIGLIRYNVPKIFDFWNFGAKPEVKKEYFAVKD